MADHDRFIQQMHVPTTPKADNEQERRLLAELNGDEPAETLALLAAAQERQATHLAALALKVTTASASAAGLIADAEEQIDSLCGHQAGAAAEQSEAEARAESLAAALQGAEEKLQASLQAVEHQGQEGSDEQATLWEIVRQSEAGTLKILAAAHKQEKVAAAEASAARAAAEAADAELRESRKELRESRKELLAMQKAAEASGLEAKAALEAQEQWGAHLAALRRQTSSTPAREAAPTKPPAALPFVSYASYPAHMPPFASNAYQHQPGLGDEGGGDGGDEVGGEGGGEGDGEGGGEGGDGLSPLDGPSHTQVQFSEEFSKQLWEAKRQREAAESALVAAHVEIDELRRRLSELADERDHGLEAVAEAEREAREQMRSARSGEAQLHQRLCEANDALAASEAACATVQHKLEGTSRMLSAVLTEQVAIERRTEQLEEEMRLALTASFEEATELERQLDTAQSQLQQHEQQRKLEMQQHEEQLKQEAMRLEAMRYAMRLEIDRLKAIIAEQPAAVERACVERVKGIEESRADLMQQVQLLKGMVKSRALDTKARAVDVGRLQHQLRVEQQCRGRERESVQSPPPRRSGLSASPSLPSLASSPPFR